MKRIIVIGCPGAGKSTLSRRLRDKTGLPLYYLDMLWHREDRTHVSREEFDQGLMALLSTDRWIIDGNYCRTLEIRLKACDTAILMDIPLDECIEGVFSRVGKPREDMPWREQVVDDEFLEFIQGFDQKEMPGIRALLEQYGEGCTVHVFHSRREADAFVDSL